MGNTSYGRHKPNKEILGTIIHCEYCGVAIDITKDDVCPGCGATYDKNKYLVQLRQYQSEMKRIREEKLKLERENMELRRRRPSKAPVLAVSICIIAVAMIFIVSVYSNIRQYTEISYWTDPDFEESEEVVETEAPLEPVEEPVTVGFGESADLNQYSVVCDKMEEYYYPWQDPMEGFYYVKLHLVVTNHSDEEMEVSRDIICQYEENGYAMQAQENTIRSEDLNTKIYYNIMSPGSSTQGWVYYEVPLNTDLILKYDEYITIHVASENCVMLEAAE